MKILLRFHLTNGYVESIFDEEFPILREVRELSIDIALLIASCNNFIWAGKIRSALRNEVTKGYLCRPLALRNERLEIPTIQTK